MQGRVAKYLCDWTDTTNARVLFDSEEHGMDHDAFHSAVIGQTNVAFIIVTDTDDVFGGFVGQPIRPKKQPCESLFLFSFQCHGRAAVPARWFVTPEKVPTHRVFWFYNVDNGNGSWFQFGTGEKLSFGIDTWCFCNQVSQFVDGLGDETLAGVAWPDFYVPKRLLVVSLSR